MRTFAKIVTSSASVAAAATTTTQQRAMHEYLAFGQTQASAKHTEQLFDQVFENTRINKLPEVAKNMKTAQSVTGSAFNPVFDEESMFTPEAYLSVEAKHSTNLSAGRTLAKYVVPTIDADVAAAANTVFERFAKDTDQVELFFRKYIRNFPATIHVLGTPAEVAAFEENEAAKIPNNKLIVGRTNAKTTFKHARDDVFEFFTTLMHMGAASEAEIAKYGGAAIARLVKDSFISIPHFWRLEEEIVRSIESLPQPASVYDRKCVVLTLERSLKAALNGYADLPFVSESATDITRGLQVTMHRPCVEAGLW